MNSDVPFSSSAWLQNRPTKDSISHVDAEICVNCWYFVDPTGIVLRLAAKAYALCGSDKDKLATLRVLSGTDYLTAIQGKVPRRYVLDVDGQQLCGALPSSVLEMDPIPVFENLFEQIARTLPELFRPKGFDYETFKMSLREPFLWVSTAVFESEDGSLIARVS